MITHEKKLQSLADEVKERIGKPVNNMAVLATLESLGLYATDIQQDYGVRKLSALAELIYDRLQGIAEEEQKDADELVPVSDYLWVRIRLLSTYFPLGLFHLLPVLVQILAIIIFGYSLWASLGFNVVQSTAVVMGILLGLIISGGYVQVLGKQAGFYWNNQDKAKALALILGIYWNAVKGFILIFSFLAIVSFLFSLYPISVLLIAFAYAFGIGMLLLVYAPFHTIRRRWFISLGIILATVLALILETSTELHTYVTHWIGMFAGILIALAGLRFYFRDLGWRAFKAGKGINKQMVISKNYQYFLYGALIYVFIFIDRLVAWSGNIGISHDFLFIYEKKYEIGMDLAILVFFMLAGVLEYGIAAFSKFMDLLQKSSSATALIEFNRFFVRMYHRHLLILAGCAALAAVVVRMLIYAPWGYIAAFGEPLTDLSLDVAIIGGLGYFFLAWGMLNSLYMFTLNVSSNALMGLLYACGLNLGSGYIFSRMFGFEYSAVGMLLGSVFFAAYTYRGCISYFRNLDHRYYAAY